MAQGQSGIKAGGKPSWWKVEWLRVKGGGKVMWQGQSGRKWSGKAKVSESRVAPGQGGGKASGKARVADSRVVECGVAQGQEGCKTKELGTEK